MESATPKPSIGASRAREAHRGGLAGRDGPGPSVALMKVKLALFAYGRAGWTRPMPGPDFYFGARLCVTGLFPPQRFAFASSLSSALRNGMSRHSYWHAILSAAKIRWSGPAGHGYLSTRPLCLPELCGASARRIVVPVQGVKPGRKKGLAPAKRSLCFFGRLSPHAGRIANDWLKNGCDLSRARGRAGWLPIATPEKPPGPAQGPCSIP